MEDKEEKKVDLTVDACGLKCPMPILRAKKALANMESGQLLKVLATDPAAAADFHFSDVRLEMKSSVNPKIKACFPLS